MKKKKKKRERQKCYVHNIFHNTFTTNLKQQIIINGKKIILVMSIIRTSNNLTPRICCEKCCECSTFLKKRKEKREQYTRKFIIFFTIVELVNFNQFSPKSTTNITPLSLIPVCTKNRFVSLSDDKQLLSGAGIIS